MAKGKEVLHFKIIFKTFFDVQRNSSVFIGKVILGYEPLYRDLPSFCFHSDSADKVVQGEGKFEEIVVASNEITASTVQLVSDRYCSFCTSFWTLHTLEGNTQRNNLVHVTM